MAKSTDSATFSEAQRAILETALKQPELTNAEIADNTGTRIALVRDTRAEYEDEVVLADSESTPTQSAAPSESSETADSQSTAAEPSELQQAILEAVAANPQHTNSEIAEATGARITLVRDTRDTYDPAAYTTESADSASTAEADDDSASTSAYSGRSETQEAILAAALADPELTNAEIAAETGARIALVRDTREEYEDEISHEDFETAPAETPSADASTADGSPKPAESTSESSGGLLGWLKRLFSA